MKKRRSLMYNGCLKHATTMGSPQKDGLQKLWQKIAKAVSSIAFLPMIEYRTARSSTYLLISEAIVAIVKAKRSDFRMCHGDENRCGIYSLRIRFSRYIHYSIAIRPHSPTLVGSPLPRYLYQDSSQVAYLS